jgi:hypothetical protein
MTEIPKITSIVNNSLHSTQKSDAQNTSFAKKSLSMNPSNQYDTKRVIKVPVKFVDDPQDEFFLLQIPKNKLNISRLSSILKIEVLRNNEHNLKDTNRFKNVEANNMVNGSLTLENLNPSIHNNNTKITAQSVLNINNSKFYKSHDDDASKNDVFVDDDNKRLFLESNETGKSDLEFEVGNLNSSNNYKADAFPSNLKNNSAANVLTPHVQKSDKNQNKGAIYNAKNVLINDYPIFDANESFKNSEPFDNAKNSTGKKKIHRQRVLIYQRSTKRQPQKNSSQRRWIMKKIVRRRVTPARLKLTDDLETSVTAPMAI